MRGLSQVVPKLHRIDGPSLRRQPGQVTAIGQIAHPLESHCTGQGEQGAHPFGVEGFEVRPTKDVGIVHHEHAPRQLGQERIGAMNLCFVIVPKVQPDGRMTATFGQHHRPCLRIGSLAVLVATASKGRRVGLGIGYIEQAAVQGHQPIAPIPGTLGLGRTQEVCALLKEPLQRLHSQDGPLITQG